MSILNGHKDLTCDKEVLTLPEPDDLYIPLVNGRAECKPLVAAGIRSKLARRLASRPVHSGMYRCSHLFPERLSALRNACLPDWKPVDHLHIKNDHKQETVCAFAPFDWDCKAMMLAALMICPSRTA